MDTPRKGCSAESWPLHAALVGPGHTPVVAVAALHLLGWDPSYSRSLGLPQTGGLPLTGYSYDSLPCLWPGQGIIFVVPRGYLGLLTQRLFIAPFPG